ncbi:hypothetical protein [Desulfuromonas sp. TF]|uniref:hypothetical protein n=1 Tax=Desulfuromonas sp. TF TaxID=1232410 RepID=UPI0005560241|nr:hypothetical protein [Desulfuromonas sp. TF]
MKKNHSLIAAGSGTLALALILAGMLIQGCARQGYSVLASTGTLIGVEISQNPASQAPQAKLGYNRAELAFVPTNRAAGENPGNTHHGARDSANVIMELKYAGIFDWGSNSGIYQRLAVGDLAVQQPGAAAMFIRKGDGTVDDEAVKALEALKGISEPDISVEKSKKTLSEKYLAFKSANNTAAVADFDKAAKDLGRGYNSFGAFSIDPKATAADVEKVKKALEAQGYSF